MRDYLPSQLRDVLRPAVVGAIKGWETLSLAPGHIRARLQIPASLKRWQESRHSRQFWANREKDNPNYVAGYWAQQTHPLRARIAQTVTTLNVNSVLEVGCHCGVNLYNLAKRKTYRDLAGVDVSEHVLEQGRRLLAQHTEHPIELVLAPATKLPFGDKSFDLVLSVGTLVCVGATDIGKALQEITRVSGRHIVLAEPFPDPSQIGAEQYPNTTYWIRDYAPALMALGFKQISMQHMPEGQNIGHMNSIAFFQRS